MSILVLAMEYERSAAKIKERIVELRGLQKKKEYDEQKKLEDRLTILTAEYYHLLHTAAYLKSYAESAIASEAV